jgi:hypothetical protein
MTNKAPVRIVLLVAGLFAWLFGEALFGGGMFVFRDAGHYYYPLLHFVRDEWLAGRVPLWNPYENLGVPLAGNPTAAVFYPGTLILLLPVGFAWAYKFYVMAHALLAAWGAYRLARHWQASVEGAGIAAISYAFGGNVLFQYTNVVFLVGAAWLPLAVLAADRMVVERRLRWALLFGMVLALMTLGGDPQMAYHAVLVAAMAAFSHWWWERSHSRCKEQAAGRRRPMLLVVAATVGLMLAAIQVVPSFEFSRRSGRTQSRVPRTIHEIFSTTVRAGACRPDSLPIRPDSPGAIHPFLEEQKIGTDGEKIGAECSGSEAWSDGLTCRRLEPGSHHENLYQFSVGPWRWAEWFWPNIGGRQFPVHRRWLDCIPAEGRIWVPSLYMGLLPLVLGLAAVRFRRSDARTHWLSWLVLLSVLASLGCYGPGWVWKETQYLMHGPSADAGLAGGPFGGLYWLMTVVLPGYIYFRYPAKLLVLTAFGLSMLAAAGWDRVQQGSAERTRRGLAVVGGVSLLGLIVFGVLQPWWSRWLGDARPDAVFGPLDVAGATRDVVLALAQTTLLAAVFWWLLGNFRSRHRWVQLVVLLLVVLDLGIANRWMVACAPGELWESPSKLAAAIQEHQSQHGDGQPCRVYRESISLPPAWQHHASPARLTELARWERDTLAPKHNLLDRVSLVEVYGTMMLSEYETLLNALKRNGQLGQLGVRYQVLSNDRRGPGGEAVRIEAASLKDGALWCDPQCLPRVQIVRQEDPIAPGESCRVVRDEPAEVEVEARLACPGLVVLRDQYYPGWRLEVETVGQGRRDVPIVRAEGVMRGVSLPAGQHRLIYRYRPASAYWGAAVSGLAWLGLAIVGFVGWRRSTAPTR